MGVLLFFLIGYVVLCVGLMAIFPKAEVAAWKAWVPGLNFAAWCRIIGRTPAHALWLLAPIVNIFIFAGMAVDLARSFRETGFWHSVLAVVLAPFYFLYIGYSKKHTYAGPVLTQEKAFNQQLEEARQAKNTRQYNKLQSQNPYKKSPLREWAEAIIFAVFAAAFIRMFLIEAYVIPTSSMEGSLMVGDFLFVSKAHYGIRMPQTVAMLPLLHNRIPVVGGESYLKKPQLDYKRLPAIEYIDHNDPVVFNYPEGDSVFVFPQRTWSIYDSRRGSIPPPFNTMIDAKRVKMVTRPMDKMDHYIKRCIGLPGDTLEVRNRQVYIDGKVATNPKYLQYIYHVTSEGAPLNTRNFSDWGISDEDRMPQSANDYYLVLNQEQKAKIQAMDPNIKVENVDIESLYREGGNLFPHDKEHFGSWSRDNYGPIYIPKAGATISITPANIALYRRVIGVYEGHQLAERDGKIFIDGKEATQYTFAQNYYWMMGDNRHNSEDSRFWGFVPATHVVGKPLFIWFSLKEGSLSKGINWNRLFSGADKR